MLQFKDHYYDYHIFIFLKETSYFKIRCTKNISFKVILLEYKKFCHTITHPPTATEEIQRIPKLSQNNTCTRIQLDFFFFFSEIDQH